MSLLDTLKEDLLAARKTKNTTVIGVLSTLLGDLETNSKKTGKAIVDADIITLAKNRINTIQGLVETVSNADKTASFEAEIPLYEKYIPTQLTESEILVTIARLKAEVEGLNIGQVQAYFRNTYPGRYDAKLVTQVFQAS
jgi:uncharacterized protein YqeY